MTKKLCWVCVSVMFAWLTCAASISLAASPPATAAQEKLVEALVKSAVKLIEAKGEAAFGELNVKNGPWHKGTTSIFVSDDKGLELVNPAQPELVGKNLWNYKDSDGKLVVQEQWKLIKARGKGWMDCKWVKPGTTREARCRVFVQGVKVKGKHFLVGAAYYLP